MKRAGWRWIVGLALIGGLVRADRPGAGGSPPARVQLAVEAFGESDLDARRWTVEAEHANVAMAAGRPVRLRGWASELRTDADGYLPASLYRVGAGVSGAFGRELWDVSVESVADRPFRSWSETQAGGRWSRRYPLRPGDSLQVGLAYQTNRSFLPGIPLPFLVWSRMRPSGTVMVGLPFTRFEWTPRERLAVRGSAMLVGQAGGSVAAEWAFTENLKVAVEWAMARESYLMHDREHRDDRLNLDRRTAVARITRSLGRAGELSLYAGGAFRSRYYRTDRKGDREDTERQNDSVLGGANWSMAW